MKYSFPQKKSFLDPEKNDNFCIFPWIHLYTEPDGKTYPCCNTEQNTINETTQDKTLSEIFNSDSWNQLRLDMLNNKKNKICNRCHAVEETGNPSYRNFANNDFEDYIDIIDDTNQDGSLDEFKLRYIDVRWSNQCNFACAPCSPVFSTKWIQMRNKTNRSEGHVYTKISNNTVEDIISQLEPHLEDCHQIYFAGGEPLIIDDHYRLLELLEQKSILDVKLRYNTNLSTLNYKKRSAIDYWSSFNNVEIGASIDAVGDRAEIIRYGTDWKQIEQNIKDILPHDNIVFNYNTTVTTLNIDHLTEMYDYIFENNLIKKSSWLTTNIAFSPFGYHLTNLPNYIKDEISSKIIKWTENLPNRDFNCDVSPFVIEDLQEKMISIVKFMEKSDDWMFSELEKCIEGTMFNDGWKRIPHLKQIYRDYSKKIIV